MTTEVMATIVDVLHRLVAFPTESRTSNTDLIDYYADRAVALGGRVTVVSGDPGGTDEARRANLYVTFGPETDGGLFLSGHTDVVPAGTGWATDPYQLTPVDDRLYGRGTADMKGFLAVALAAVKQTDAKRLLRPVHLGLSYDEEIGCVGVHHLLDHLRNVATCRPDVIIVGEPTRMQLCTAHSGKQVFTVEITSPSGHSSRSPEQATAIEAGAAIVTAVSEVNAAARENGGGWSTNVGTIGGGVAVNVLAPHCELDFECRHQADHSPDHLLQPVMSTIELWADRLREIGGDVTVAETVSYPPLATSRDEPGVSRVRRSLGDPAFGEISFGCEAGLYVEAVPAPAVIWGPGNIADAHRPGEYVLASDLALAAGHLTATINQLCVGANESED